MARKLHVANRSNKTKVHVLALAQQTTLENCTQQRLQRMESDSFTDHYLIRLLSAGELVLPP